MTLEPNRLLRGIALTAVLGLGLAAIDPAAAQQQQQQPRQQQAQPKGKKPAAQNAQRQAAPAPEQPGVIDTVARQAIIVDAKSGLVLFEKNADEIMPPSSMSKIMTAYMVFKRLSEGSIKLTDKLPVSERAWKMGGSKTFVPLGEMIAVEDLLRGMIVQSGNDACIVLAEGLAGTEEAFAEMMVAEGKRIGLRSTTFKNATGWPDPEHLTTARDLSIIAKHVVEDYPAYYHYYREIDFTYNGIKQGNRNPLLYKNSGADGLKTGHTEAAGYGLTASAVREGRRLIMVLNGLPSIRVRAEESARLMEWAFREFGHYPLFTAGATVDRAEVWQGEAVSVPLTVAEDFAVTLPRKARPQMKVTAVYDGPLAAPILKGTPVGTLVVTAPGVPPIETPLVAAEDVPRLGFAGRVGAGVTHLLFGSVVRR